MALVNQTLPGLFGGVSQQAPELRHDTQVNEMINCYPSVVGGLQKRPPSSLVFGGGDPTGPDYIPSDTFVYTYERDSDERYAIFIKSGGYYRIYDLILQQWCMLDWEYNLYLTLGATANIKKSFAASTVRDTTFIVNKTTIPTKSSTLNYNTDSTWETTFYYWVKRTAGDAEDNSSLRYTYYIEGEGVDIETTNHDSTDAALSLASQLNAITGIAATSSGSIVKAYVSNGITLKGSDSWGNQASNSWQGSIRKLADLPTDFPWDGAIIQVAGDDDSASDNFYVKAVDGVIKETFKPGIVTDITSSTLPHRIVIGKDANGNYINVNGDYGPGTSFFSSIDWGSVTVGDEDSAGMPSFIEYSKPIQDIFLYRNRLGLLSGDNITLSETGEYYNFFPTSVTTIVDSDTIDVAVDSNQAVVLKYAIPYNKELLIFGTNAQYIMSSGDTLTPNGVSVQQSTAFNISSVPPVGIGPNVYFGIEKNNFSAIREYYVQPDSLSNDAADVTAHCPAYIPNDLKAIVGSAKNDMVFALSSMTPDTLYVYNFYWNGEEKAQSAWHKWTFNGAIIHDIQEVSGDLYLFTDRSTDSFIEKINLEKIVDISNIRYEDMASGGEGTGILIDTTVELSEIGFQTGNAKVDDKRNKFVLKNIQINADYGSFYNVEVLKYTIPKKYGYTVNSGIYPSKDLVPSYTLLPKVSSYEMTTDGKYPVSGKADKLSVKINNDLIVGFKINTLNLFGNFVQQSRSM